MCGVRVAGGGHRPLITAVMSAPLSDTPTTAVAAGENQSPRWLIVAGISLVLIVAAHLADAWAWAHILDLRVYERDWGRMLRSAGYLPTWLIVAIALAAHDKGTAGWKWRGGLMVLVPTVAGASAEVLKLLFRRLRPGDTSPAYVFRSFTEDFWSNKGLGMPSSHMMVAMGAAVVLARLFPRVWWMWYLVAIGCGVTRVLARAHYLSDVVVAGVVAYLLADAMCRWGLKRRTSAEL